MDIFSLIKRGGPITAKDLEPKIEDFIPNYDEIKNAGNFTPIGQDRYAHLYKSNNLHNIKEAQKRSDGFVVVASKEKIEKKKDECNSDCKRTTGDKKISQKGIDFLKGYESEVKKNGKHVLYDDDLGYCTIGYGHLVNGKKSCSKISQTYKSKYAKGLTDKEAENLFRQDIEEREKAVNKKVKKPICQQEFDALLSLYYNIPKAFSKKYKLINKLNKGDYAGAKKEFASWRKGGGKVLSGLVKRRKGEMKIFECGIYDSTH